MLNATKSSQLNSGWFSVLVMMTSTLSERVRVILSELGLNQTAFAEYVGVTKGAVNQWLSETVKSIDPEYAFALQHKAGYSAEWVMFGVGPKKLLPEYAVDPKVASVVSCMQRMGEYDKDTLVKISASLVDSKAAEPPDRVS